ncbi:MAG: response regulator [Acidobacteria bacterium]|nr:response regulator [Acidobacteriota bacterium]MCZ6752393.1 response regulator [Acidobacteriota bacterium]
MTKVLLVDDDPSVLAIATKRLEAEAVQILTATDGVEALRIIRESHPDVVVLDVMMPKMHGYTVIQEIRKDSSLSHVKVIVSSAKTYPADVETAMQLGADRFLSKPYSLDEFWKTIEELMGQRRSRFTVRFWGTRGSIATPGLSTVKYGGNTACTEVRCGDQLLILDAGTGIRPFGLSLLNEFQGKPIKAHIFVGHTHWDHIQGFPFFAPAFLPGNEFTVYSLHGAGKPLEKIFRGQMDSDYFPVHLGDMKAKLQFCELESDVQLGDTVVSYTFLNHPGLAIGFRICSNGRSLVYLSDHESYGRLSPDGDSPNEMDLAIARFAEKADLLICEAQYTEEEYKQKRGWGHSTFLDVLERAAQAEVGRLAIFHHDPSHDDAFMDHILEFCQNTIAERKYQYSCFLAQEGMSVEL